MDSVLSRILMVAERPAVSAGLALLQQCVALDPPDPLLLSLLLSFISALFVFLSMSSCQMSQGESIFDCYLIIDIDIVSIPHRVLC